MIDRISRIRILLRNFLSLSAAQFFSRFIGFLVVAHLARTLGTENFGKIAFAEVILAYFLLASKLGLDTVATRDIAKHKSVDSDFVNSIITLRIILSVLSYGLILVLAQIINNSHDVKVLIAYYGILLFPAAVFLDWLYQGIERMHIIGMVRIIEKISYLLLILVFVSNQNSLTIIPFILVSCHLFSVFLLILNYPKGFGLVKIRYDPKRWKYLLREALPLGIANFMVLIYYYSDTVMLSLIKNNTEVGLYNAAYKIVLVLISFGGLAGTSILPIISSYYNDSIDMLTSFVQGVSRIMIMVGLPLALVLTMLAKPIFLFIYGATYLEGVKCLQILIWSVFTIYCNVPFTFVLIGSGNQKYFLVATSLGAAVNVGLNFLAIPNYGKIGASFTTICSEILVLVLLYLFCQKICRVGFLQQLYNPVIAAISSGLLVSVIGLNPFIGVALGLAIYLLLLYFLKGVTKGDLSMVSQIIRCTK